MRYLFSDIVPMSDGPLIQRCMEVNGAMTQQRKESAWVSCLGAAIVILVPLLAYAVLA